MKKSILLAASSAFVLLLSTGCGPKSGGADTLNLYIWEEYMDPEVLRDFEAETGIRVVESNYGSNEEMLAKLQVGGGGYDLVVPSDYVVAMLRRQGLLAPLDLAKLPGLANLHERFKAPPFDPGHAHSVPFQWGLTGIAYNRAELARPPRSWAEFFDVERAAAARGRISLLNDAREVFASALLALGKNPSSRDPADITAAKELLRNFKPFVAKFDSEAFEDSLAAGETLLVQGWSGEITVAMEENDRIEYVIPEDGAIAFVDNLVILAASKRTEAAHRFIDFVLRPDIAARIANFTYYGTCNGAAVDGVDEFLRNGPPFQWPSEEKTHFLEDLGDAARLYDQAWTELKSL